jgi:uncharacterized protein (TIGR02444 family)
MNGSESAFWPFSLRFYAKPGVPELCLALQDQHEADVNLLFLLLFLAKHGRRLTVDEVRAMDRETAPWRTSVVQPLRALRRQLKNGFPLVEAAAAEALRGKIKRCELQAEKLQQEMMERRFVAAAVGVPCEVSEAAAANVEAYFSVIGPAGKTQSQTPAHALLAIFNNAFLP